MSLQQHIDFLVKAIYVYNPTGGPLHIVLDDCNIDTESINWCVENTIPKTENLFVKLCCEKLCQILLASTLEQRIEYLHIDPDEELITHLKEVEFGN